MANKEDMVYQRADGLFDWRLRDGNGQIVATSGDQGYQSKSGAHEGLRNAIEEFAKIAVDVVEDGDG